MIPRDIIVDLDAVTYNAKKLASHQMPDGVDKITGTADEDWAVEFHTWLTDAANLLSFHTETLRELIVQNADALTAAATTLEDQDKLSSDAADAAGETVAKTAANSDDPNIASGAGAVVPAAGGGL